MSPTYTLFVWPKRMIGYSWEGLDSTILNVGKQPRDHIAELIQRF